MEDQVILDVKHNTQIIGSLCTVISETCSQGVNI